VAGRCGVDLGGGSTVGLVGAGWVHARLELRQGDQRPKTRSTHQSHVGRRCPHATRPTAHSLLPSLHVVYALRHASPVHYYCQPVVRASYIVHTTSNGSPRHSCLASLTWPWRRPVRHREPPTQKVEPPARSTGGWSRVASLHQTYRPLPPEPRTARVQTHTHTHTHTHTQLGATTTIMNGVRNNRGVPPSREHVDANHRGRQTASTVGRP
jgi:hypothetical protein